MNKLETIVISGLANGMIENKRAAANPRLLSEGLAQLDGRSVAIA